MGNKWCSKLYLGTIYCLIVFYEYHFWEIDFNYKLDQDFEYSFEFETLDLDFWLDNRRYVINMHLIRYHLCLLRRNHDISLEILFLNILVDSDIPEMNLKRAFLMNKDQFTWILWRPCCWTSPGWCCPVHTQWSIRWDVWCWPGTVRPRCHQPCPRTWTCVRPTPGDTGPCR